MDKYTIKIIKEKTEDKDEGTRIMQSMMGTEYEDIKFEGTMNADDCIEILQHLNRLITKQR